MNLDPDMGGVGQYRSKLLDDTLGCAAGAADGRSWEKLVQARILDPLGMDTANFSHVAA